MTDSKVVSGSFEAGPELVSIMAYAMQKYINLKILRFASLKGVRMPLVVFHLRHKMIKSARIYEMSAVVYL